MEIYICCDDLSLVIKAKTFRDLQNFIEYDLKIIGTMAQKKSISAQL